MSISRRGFFKGMITGAGVLAAGPALAAHKRFKGHEGRFGMLLDTTRCVGCRSCEVACREVNYPDEPALEVPLEVEDAEGKLVFNDAVYEAPMNPRGTTDESLTVVNRYTNSTTGEPVYRKQQCMHCNEPCCASVCFVNAFTKTKEGPVLYDPSVCVGCRYCVMACPYYALSYEYDEPGTPRVMRCTMCYPRIKEGKNPACADACPMGAIQFGPREELIRIGRDRIRKHPDQYIDHIYGEHEYGGTSWMVLSPTRLEDIDLPANAPHTPIPEYGSGFLSIVPLVITIYPGLLLGFKAWSSRKDKLAAEDKANALAEAQAKAEAETKKEVDATRAAGVKAKERAIAKAVKEALAKAEAEAKAKAEGAGEDGGD